MIPHTNYYAHNSVGYPGFLPNYHNPPVPFPPSYGVAENFTQVNLLSTSFHSGSFLMPPNPFYPSPINPRMIYNGMLT